MLDGEPLSWEEFFYRLEHPVPAGQSDEEVEASWQKYKEEHGIE